MANIKFKLNYEGIRSILKGEAMQAVCEDQANRIASAAGEGYKAKSFLAPTRVVSRVYASTPEAIKDNSENNTLLKVMR